LRWQKSTNRSTPTNGNWVINVFWFDNVTQKHGRLLLALNIVVVVKDDPRRVNDAHATLELNGLQFFRVPWLSCNGTHLRRDASSKWHEKHRQLMTNMMAHLGALEGVDQTALADVREANDADSDALGRAWFVCLDEAKQGGCRSRGKIRPLMRARGAKRERWCCVAEVFEPSLGVRTWHQI
jgi:hypothetical protein